MVLVLMQSKKPSSGSYVLEASASTCFFLRAVGGHPDLKKIRLGTPRVGPTTTTVPPWRGVLRFRQCLLG